MPIRISGAISNERRGPARGWGEGNGRVRRGDRSGRRVAPILLFPYFEPRLKR